MSNEPEVVLRAEHLVKHFPVKRGVVLSRTVGAVRAVDDVSFELRRGETVGIVGESGCGKSTLASLLVGLEKPTSGRILINGEDVTGLGREGLRKLRRNVQMVFQDPYTSLNPRMSVGDIVGEPYAIHSDAVPAGGKDKAIRELLDLVGLNPDHINRYPHQFSGGQRQRIGIARALALRPEILICDEPVSALDVSIQGQVINLLERLQSELAMSYVFIAHDLSVVRHIADRVAVMYLGRMMEYGTETEVYDHAMHPYTQSLLSAAPVPDPTMRDRGDEIILEGDVPSPTNPPSGCRFHTRCWRAKQLVEQDPEQPVERPPEQAAEHPAERTAEQGREQLAVRTNGQPGVPSVCRTEDPQLVVRAGRDGAEHPVACHFAAERELLR